MDPAFGLVSRTTKMETGLDDPGDNASAALIRRQRPKDMVVKGIQ